MTTMKTTKWMLLLLPAMLFSCSSDDESGLGGQPVAVQFGTGNIAGLRTNITDGGVTQWVKDGDHIGIFMVENGQALSADKIVEGAANVEYKADEGGDNTSFSPVSGTPIYYPKSGDAVNFIAYYPYKSPLDDDYKLPINVGDQSNASNIDVLYSNDAIGRDKNSGTVVLEFSHALSKLNFTLLKGIGSPNLAGATLQITNVATTATMDLSNGEFSEKNDGQTLTANTATNGLSSSAIVIPQTPPTGAKLIVTLDDDDVSKFECNFPDPTEWEAGKQYTYNITVNRTGITVTTGNIGGWGGAELISGWAGAWKVGDYYPDPNNASTAIGVVFWVDPADSRHGKVVGLKEIGGMAWSSITKTTDATHVSNGRENMRIIYGLGNDFSDYPAFKWVHDEMNGGNTTNYYSDVTGVWYLPAKEELKHLYCAWNGVSPQTWGDSFAPFPSDGSAQTAFNDKLEAVGGIGLISPFYWSSSEVDGGYYAWHVYFSFAGYPYYSSKGYANDDYSVRCILAF